VNETDEQARNQGGASMKEFKDKVAVVTGAASGIGRAMAEMFAAAGMKVVLSDIEKSVLEETARSLAATGADVHATVADVSDSEQVEQLAEQTLRKYGAVHVLCNNAGVTAGVGPSWLNTVEDWNWILGVNLMGVVHGVRTFLPIMIRQATQAHIINTASMGGFAIGGSALYCASKFAVVAFSESVHLDLQRSQLKPKISVLCPGYQRNRPAGNKKAPEPADPVTRAFREWYGEQLKGGLGPSDVADQVLDAIREERFYIFTHPEWLWYVEQRMKDILKGNNPTAMPPPGFESLTKKLTALGVALR
jgi:NAD(P)-dependent dehydrogenase (short-subunit alcohol dehydrogenase family)